jgi:hypothetical protein
MTLKLLHSEFSDIHEENSIFFFISEHTPPPPFHRRSADYSQHYSEIVLVTSCDDLYSPLFVSHFADLFAVYYTYYHTYANVIKL